MIRGDWCCVFLFFFFFYLGLRMGFFSQREGLFFQMSSFLSTANNHTH
jgi:hypothetical protein